MEMREGNLCDENSSHTLDEQQTRQDIEVICKNELKEAGDSKHEYSDSTKTMSDGFALQPPDQNLVTKLATDHNEAFTLSTCFNNCTLEDCCPYVLYSLQ